MGTSISAESTAGPDFQPASEPACELAWRTEVRRYDDPITTELIRQLQAIFVQRYGGPDVAVVDPDEFSPPRGLFLVGFHGREPVATGGWRRTVDQVAEIKRMYVVPSAQGQGLSRLMLAALERTAQAAGVTEFVLNTGAQQPEAIALYESSGYRSVPGYGVYADEPGAFFYGKSLG